jgi:hypothetical protein
MRVGLNIAAAAVLVFAGLLPSPAHADGAIEISTTSRNFARFGSATLPGGLDFLGGLTLQAGNDDFGGFSGLDVSPDGKSFLAVSDRGHWFAGDFVYRDGRLTGVTNTKLAPLRDGNGKVDRRKSRSDAEAVAAWTSRGIRGKVIVGFERRERVELFNLGGKRGLKAQEPSASDCPGPSAKASQTANWKRLAGFWTGR